MMIRWERYDDGSYLYYCGRLVGLVTLQEVSAGWSWSTRPRTANGFVPGVAPCRRLRAETALRAAFLAPSAEPDTSDPADLDFDVSGASDALSPVAKRGRCRHKRRLRLVSFWIGTLQTEQRQPTMAEIQNALRCAPSTVARDLAALEAMGYFARGPRGARRISRNERGDRIRVAVVLA